MVVSSMEKPPQAQTDSAMATTAAKAAKAGSLSGPVDGTLRTAILVSPPIVRTQHWYHGSERLPSIAAPRREQRAHQLAIRLPHLVRGNI
ncbi:MAG TPA: hypothetical protein VEL28_10695 [Candidatus Binatia bacterium]|nr:hypothetical protein [Candidatus Binatia bacterium]